MPPRRVVRRPAAHVAPSSAAPASDVVTVGLDPSLTGYGIVLWRVGTAGKAFLLKTAADGETYAMRLQQIHDQLVSILGEVKDDVGIICMERPAYAASGAFTGGLVHAATALALLHVFGPGDRRIAPVLVATNTLKKFVTGKGVGQKGLMVKYVYQKWGFDTDDDNLADAFGLARLASAVLSGEWQYEYEKQCIETIRKSAVGAMKFAPLKTSATTHGRSTESTTTVAHARTRSTQSGVREIGNALARSASNGVKTTASDIARTTVSTRRGSAKNRGGDQSGVRSI